MHEHHPPRREPRVLVLRPLGRRVLWAAADPWELRGAGRLGTPVAVTLARTVHQIHPSVVLLVAEQVPAPLTTALDELTARRGIPHIEPTKTELRALRRAARACENDEVLALLHDRALRRTAALALAALGILELPSRRYVSKLPPAPTPRVGADRA